MNGVSREAIIAIAVVGMIAGLYVLVAELAAPGLVGKESATTGGLLVGVSTVVICTSALVQTLWPAAKDKLATRALSAVGSLLFLTMGLGVVVIGVTTGGVTAAFGIPSGALCIVLGVLGLVRTGRRGGHP